MTPLVGLFGTLGVLVVPALSADSLSLAASVEGPVGIVMKEKLIQINVFLNVLRYIDLRLLVFCVLRFS